MTIRTNTPKLLDNPPIPVQAKLAAAWTSLMFLYAYVDILAFHKPGVVEDILVGVVWAGAVVVDPGGEGVDLVDGGGNAEGGGAGPRNVKVKVMALSSDPATRTPP